MLGQIEFHNSMKYMFFNNNALKEVPLANFRNKKLLMDLDFSYSLLQQNQMELNIEGQFKKFQQLLEKYNLDFSGICQGSDPLIGNDYIFTIERFPQLFNSFI